MSGVTDKQISNDAEKGSIEVDTEIVRQLQGDQLDRQ